MALIGDIKKMYHSVKTSELDQHTHRFLWHDMDTTKEVDTYFITTISFGDKPAGNIATLTLCKTARMEGKEFTEASDGTENY